MGIVSGVAGMGEVKTWRLGLKSSAALGTAHRVGFAKLKHIHAKYLWVQRARNDGRLGAFRVDGFGKKRGELYDEARG